ncbi:MAG TPA: FtsW/RodA/SpoVE family cell cycle protein, partial [Pseudonocardia sp.]|nr:FtsW/RodA/SpoVE family cell cycle protein [Pseudonocardia sp.]
MAVAGAAGWLPAPERPSMVFWLAGTAVLAAIVCLVPRRRLGTAGLVAAATVLGALVQLRLGHPASRLAVGAAVAAAAWVGAVSLGRSVWFSRTVADSYLARMVALGAIASGTALRALTLLGPRPAAGTLPVVPVQVGELTRYLIGAGMAVGVVELARSRRGYWRPADARFRAVLYGLAAVAVALLVVLRDLGPAVLIAAGVAAALLHVHGARSRQTWFTLAGLAVVLPLIAAGDTVRARLEHVLDPDPQLRSALIAAGSGGLIGPGPGLSPLVDGIPAIGSDFALAALIADLGALVVLPVVVALLATYTGLVRAGARRPGPSGTVVVALGCMLLAQAGWNALGTLAVLPLTGLNQPFLGFSGASLVTSALVVGLTLGILDGPSAEVPADSPEPGTAAVGALARAGTAVVVLLFVVAAATQAVRPRPVGDLEQTRMPRGVLWTSDGQVISLDGHRERLYPAGALYADLGRDTWGYSHRGIEATEAATLTCGGRLHLTDWLASLLHSVCKPADVVTTIDSRVQTALRDALAGRTGEAVVLDARTGAVLGLYSTAAAGDPAGARFQQRPPGSTMKLVTASASLLAGTDYTGAPADVFTGSDGQRLVNDGRETCPATDVRTALAYSCNSVLGWAATRVGADGLRRVASTYFGADRPFAFEGGDAVGLDTGLPAAATHPRVSDGALARTGIGQESVRSSVLGVALATAVIADSGTGAKAVPAPWPGLTSATCRDPRAGTVGGDGGGTGGGDGDRPGEGDVDTPVAAPVRPTVGPALPSRVGRVVYEGMRMAALRGTARALAAPGGV